jgi:hypothetical protein
MIRTFAKPLALALAVAFSAAPALAASDDEVPQDTQNAVTEKLVAEGYDVRSIQMEDGMIEVYATKDGEKLEIYLDAELNVVETKVAD